MKKIFCIFIILALVFTMTSCGQTKPADLPSGDSESSISPTQTMDAFLKALKARDFEAMKEYYEGSSDDFDFSDEAADPVMGGMADTLLDKLFDFDYSLDNETISGSDATVDVHFTTYDVAALMGDILNDMLSDYVALSMAGLSQEELEAEVNKIISQKFGEAINKAEKNKEITVTSKLVKKDGKWLVKNVADSDDFMDALSGGLMKFAESMADSLS